MESFWTFSHFLHNFKIAQLRTIGPSHRWNVLWRGRAQALAQTVTQGFSSHSQIQQLSYCMYYSVIWVWCKWFIFCWQTPDARSTGEVITEQRDILLTGALPPWAMLWPFVHCPMGLLAKVNSGISFDYVTAPKISTTECLQTCPDGKTRGSVFHI